MRETDNNPIFYARIEQPAENDRTRIYVNQDYKVLWDEGDKVSIFNLKDANDEYRFTGQTGDNGGTFELVKDFSEEGVSIDHRYAVYPYSRSTSIDMKGVLSVELPSTQHYREHSFGSGDNLMVAATDSKEFQFKNVCGYLVLKLYGEGVTVSSITLKGNNGEKLAGKATVTIPVEGLPSIRMDNDASAEITLTCTNPVQLGLTAEDCIPFWFVVPPVTFSKGFTVSILEESGGTFDIETTRSISIERSHLSKMSAVEVEKGNTPDPTPEAVDLGLSVKWASFNLGASKPEEFGDYYAWGEITTYYEEGYAQSKNPVWKFGKPSGYSWSSYSWCYGSEGTLVKYNFNGNNGVVDNKSTLDLEDDAARSNWGESWRIATFDEWNELKNTNKCSWTWTTENGVKGYRVTSKIEGYKNNSIFLPASGCREGINLDIDTYNNGAGPMGRYWSSSLRDDYPYKAWLLYFYNVDISWDGGERYRGISIRPVFDDSIHPESITLNKSAMSLYIGDSEQLTTSFFPESSTDKTILWSSSNESIVSVNSDGVLTANALGSAVVTAKTRDGGKQAECTVRVTNHITEIGETFTAVDMGLSVKWASFNLGATTPVEYGKYFAWGETDSKPYFGWLYYELGNKLYPILFTKYNNNDELGVVDNLIELEPVDDAASVILGGFWRMPTIEEQEELLNNCTWEWTYDYNDSGVAGCIVTSKMTGCTDNSIFLPAAGEKDMDNISSAGNMGSYWSSSLYTDSAHFAWALCFSWHSVFDRGYGLRYRGHPIRPVYAE